MTIGETIRRIRKAYGITQKQLGDKLGVDSAAIRKYESGRSNARPKTLAKIAKALAVDPATLEESNLSASRAMIRLFRVFNAYSGDLLTKDDIIAHRGTQHDDIYISFRALNPLLRSWYNAYSEYLNKIREAENIRDDVIRQIVIDEAENAFQRWMFKYPLSEPNQKMLQLAESFDEANDFIGLHPLNDAELPLTDEEKKTAHEKLSEIYKKAAKRIPK